jgi:hypothetical protein
MTRAVLVLLLALQLACVAPHEQSDAPVESTAEASPIWFAEEAVPRGLHFVHVSGHQEGVYYLPEITSGGAALFDLDDDGDLDAYLIQFGGIATPESERPPNQLFLNDGSGRFTDVTEGSGADHRGLGNGVACGDFDGDGDVDVYVTNLGPDLLLRNDGEGRFTDVTQEAGLGQRGWGTSAAFFDMEGDGDHDLFVANYVDWSVVNERECPGSGGGADYCMPSAYDAPTADVLYRNDGGVFTDISESSGIASARGTGLGVLPADFDGDGKTDVFVANDGMLDRLWIQVEDGRFEDRALRLGCAVDEEGQAKAGMGVAAGDLDDDGDLDLLVGNLTGESDSLFRNQLVPGGGRFDDMTARARLSAVSRARTRFGLGLHDFDNDGHLDLFEANGRVTRPPRSTTGDPFAEENLLLQGEEGFRFSAPIPHAGLETALAATSRAAAFGDIDNDGGVDVLVVNRDAPASLLRNVVASRGPWLSIDVRDEHGAPAVGAVVSASAGDRTRRRDAQPAGSYQASSDPRPRVRAGAGEAPVALTVSCTNGREVATVAPPGTLVLRVDCPTP